MAAFSQWEILIARIPNTDGTAAPYAHPCIYLGDSPKKHGRIIVLGITSDLSKRVAGYSVDLPYASGGHEQTGLTEPSIAQVHWRDHIAVNEATVPVIGYVPLAYQKRVAQALQFWLAKNPTQMPGS